MWTQEKASSSAMHIMPLTDSDVSPAVAEAMTPHVRQLLVDGKLSRSSDIQEQVHGLRPNDDATVDAFIIVASHVAQSQGDLRAFVRLREWAEANRGPVMR